MSQSNKCNKNYENQQPVEWAGFLNEFLWTCAGVNKKVLRQCPTDYAKYAGIGGTILSTSLMAMLSGGYALYTVFGNGFTAMVFGIFWGLLIFNLDRFIVNTMYSDGKVTISWGEFGTGLPRIIMAIFLGIVISTPLELKIFEDAIDIRIEQDKESLINERISGTIHERDSIAKKRDEIFNGVVTIFDTEITTTSTVTNDLLSEIKSLGTEIEALGPKIEKLDAEIKGLEIQYDGMKSNNHKKADIASRLRILKNRKAELVKQKNDLSALKVKKVGEAAASDEKLKTIMEKKQEEILKERERLQRAVDSLNIIVNQANVRHMDWPEDSIKTKGSFRDKLDIEYKGFQAKMKAFSELKDESSSTYISSLFIMLLFIIIETAPTFFKMMIASGPYDDMLRAEMHRVKVLSEKSISEIDNWAKNEIRISTENDKKRIEAEIRANEDILKKLVTAQSEFVEVAIEEWRKQELEKVKNNPSTYINSTTNNS